MKACRSTQECFLHAAHFSEKLISLDAPDEKHVLIHSYMKSVSRSFSHRKTLNLVILSVFNITYELILVDPGSVRR